MADQTHEDTLMQKAAAGSREAMDRLYADLAPPLYNYVLRLSGDPERADDALQTTFLNAWHGRASFRGKGARPWFFVIARNAVFRHFPGETVLESVDSVSSATSPADEHQATELADRLDEALARLSADTREAIVLSRLSGLSLEEIADLLGVSNGALRVRLSRGLKRLKEELEL
jgi:RNA polymerase sigma-70 factor (ECF subfamily)